MKKLLFISLSILIISFLASCKKNDDATPTKATVSGRVLQLNSTIPVPNATVYLYESIWSGGLGGGEFTITKDTTITNSKGEYSFEYTQGKSSEFFVKAYADDYDTDNNTRWTIENKNQVRDVIIAPYAWVKIRIINVPPVAISDFISVGGPWGSTEDFDRFGKCDTLITKRALGNQKISIAIFFLKNSKIYLDRRDSLYCKGLDTTFHTITY